MPITGLTDRAPSFKEVGRLRLGIPKAEAKTSGPKEISYFRADFRPDEPQAFMDFSNVYGRQPTSINFRLPFVQINRCWDAYYEAYNTSGLLGMADGERWLYLRNNKTGELVVKDGIPNMAFDKTIPVYSYKNQKGNDVAVFAKPSGRLKIVIPELHRACFVMMITHSIYNIMRISEQLAGIEILAQNMSTTLPMIPMVLTRTKETISVSFNGKKQYQEHYLVNIEVNPIWASAHFAALDRILPGVVLPELPALPHEVGESEENELEQPEEEYIPEEQEPEPEAELTLEEALAVAMAVTARDGRKYGDIPSDELVFHLNGITDSLKRTDLSQAKRQEFTVKEAAAKLILQTRVAEVTTTA